MRIHPIIKKNKIIYFILRKSYYGVKNLFYCIRHPFYIFTKRAYNRFVKDGAESNYDYPLNEKSLVFDVGGYKGCFSNYILNKYNSNIYIFEPIKEFTDVLEKRFEEHNNVKIHKYALSNQSGIADISLENDGSSLFGKKSKTNKETIQIKNISEFLQEEGIEKIDLMEVNIEGSEYPLLELMIDNGDIKKIDNLLVQFHDVSFGSYFRMRRIWKNLSKTHILRWSYRPYMWESWELRKHD